MQLVPHAIYLTHDYAWQLTHGIHLLLPCCHQHAARLECAGMGDEVVDVSAALPRELSSVVEQMTVVGE